MSYDIRTKEWIDYGEWLVEQVHFKRRNYERLMETLHESPFIVFIDRDQSRAEDGLYMRNRYYSEKNLPRDYFDDEPCSVLEMLVAFAIRIDNEWIGDPSEEHPEIIFWEMLCNLGLDEYYDKVFDCFEVDRILENWLHRDFNFDGNGSIFPLNEPEFDQREIEIWSQMNQYLMEKY